MSDDVFDFLAKQIIRYLVLSGIVIQLQLREKNQHQVTHVFGTKVPNTRYVGMMPKADLRAPFKSSHTSFTTRLTSDIAIIYDVVENFLNKAEVSKFMGISEHNVCLTVHFTCTSSRISDLTLLLLLLNPVQKSSTSFDSEPLFENQWQYSASGGFSPYPNQSVLKSSTDNELKFQQHLY